MSPSKQNTTETVSSNYKSSCLVSLVFDWRCFLPKILLMLELCMSGKAWRILRRSSLAHTMNAFIGLLMCGSLLFLPLDSLKTRASVDPVPPVGQQ